MKERTERILELAGKCIGYDKMIASIKNMQATVNGKQNIPLAFLKKLKKLAFDEMEMLAKHELDNIEAIELADKKETIVDKIISEKNKKIPIPKTNEQRTSGSVKI